MIREIVQRIERMNPWNFLWVAIVLSEIFTLAMNMTMSLLFMGRIDRQLLLIGSIDAFFVALVVGTIIIYFLRKNARLLDMNVSLQQQIRDQAVEREQKDRTHHILQHIIDRAPLGIFLVDPEGAVEYVNRAMLDLSGERHDEFLSKNVFAADRYKGEGIDEKIRTAVRGEAFSHGPVSFTPSHGEGNAIVNFMGVPFKLESKPRALVFVENLTQVKKIESELLRARDDWKDTFDTISDMITIHDGGFNIIHANKAAQKLLGIPLLEDMKNKCYSFFHGSDAPPETCPSCRSLKSGVPSVCEMFEPHLGLFLEITAIPRMSSSGEMVGLIHIARDITKRRDTEKRLNRQIDRLRALRTIDISISASLDLRLTMEIFVEQVRLQLHVDAADVMLFNPETQMLRYAAAKGFRTPRIKQVIMRAGESYAGNVILGREKIVIPDIMAADREITLGEKYKFSESYLIRDEEFQAYIGIPLIAKGNINGVLEIFHRNPFDPDDDWLEFLEALAGQAAIAIDNASLFEKLQRSRDELVLAYDITIEGWSRALDHRDKETEGHSRRVTDLTLRIARDLGVSDAELVHIRRGALLHDIGKLGVPDSILFKAEDLTDVEWKQMKRHPEIAFELLSPISFLQPAIDIPYCHHEKWDGSGYPRGLRGEQIPIAARIFSIVDLWDALLSDRPYRPAWTKERVREHIRNLRGTHFDPTLVDFFLRLDL